MPYGGLSKDDYNFPRGCFILKQAGKNRGNVYFRSTTAATDLDCSAHYASCLCKK